ncbi:hypothetical protein UB43_03445 [Pseudomonas sp. 21]|uniref:SH3 domain-containing protein n=1 Tax=Pseudomonas sp. 21 TaxID=1619948 RepID=UPI0005EAD865|nr:SH3 domain-containing protein [Pseudomonas sp. 21]KJK03565.1 hypothetical protein UB43_03445 [Pseudomonas sp. 21]
MQCRNCEQPALDNGSGLCDLHFELQRDELKRNLQASGELPVAKISSKRVVLPVVVPRRRMPLRAWVPVAALAALLVAVNTYYRDGSQGRSPAARSFLSAQAGESWVIRSSDVALMKTPAIPSRSSDMAEAMVTGIPYGATVQVIGGSAGRWKQVSLLKGGQSLDGWVLADTVPTASKSN